MNELKTAQELAELLEQRLCDEHISQHKLAKQLGVTQQFVSKAKHHMNGKVLEYLGYRKVVLFEKL